MLCIPIIMIHFHSKTAKRNREGWGGILLSPTGGGVLTAVATHTHIPHYSQYLHLCEHSTPKGNRLIRSCLSQTTGCHVCMTTIMCMVRGEWDPSEIIVRGFAWWVNDR